MNKQFEKLNVSENKFLLNGLVTDLRNAAIKLAGLALVATILFFTGKTIVENKENLFWGLTHPQLFTEVRKTYEDFGEKGLVYGLGSAKAELDRVK